MLKVLIVDDEIKVCTLLEYLVDWKSMGLEVIGTRHDGMSAFSFIQENKPDIVITDIRMPNYDGLELIRKSKEITSNIHFIIISGYSEFSYAQKAIKYGVDDYLLKPIRKKELINILTKLIQKHQVIEEEKKEKETMLERIISNEKKVKTNFLNEILASNLTDEPVLEEINKTYCCNFSEGIYQVVLIQPIINITGTDERVYDFVLSKLKDIMQNELSSFNEIITTVKDEYVYCLINGTKEQFSDLKKQLKKVKTSVLSLKDVIGDIRIYIALSSEKTKLRDIVQCIEEVKHAILNKITMNTDFLEYTYTTHDEHKLEEIIDNKFRKDFLLNIETLNELEQHKLLNKLKISLKTAGEISGQLIFKIYNEIIELFNFGVKVNNIKLKRPNFQDALVKDFIKLNSIDEIFDNLFFKLNEMLCDWQNEKKLENSKPIRLAKQYINENYDQALTLEIIGDRVGLNPAYFSSVFKKETGKNFVDYLTEIRIQNAKQILLETEIAINDISEMVGFSDIKYFTKKFKKLTGLSPSDFRKLYS